MYQNTWRDVENDRILIFTFERTSKIDREFCRANCPAHISTLTRDVSFTNNKRLRIQFKNLGIYNLIQSLN